MTVQELKQRLDKCPDNATVSVRDNNGVIHEANQFDIHFDDTQDTVDVVIDWVVDWLE